MYALAPPHSTHSTTLVGCSSSSPIVASKAREHIELLRGARLDIAIRVCWCPAPKVIPANEKADEWANLAAQEPDAEVVERLGYSDWTVSGSSKRLASRFYQLNTGHCLTGQYLNCTRSPRPRSAGGVRTGRRRESMSLRYASNGGLAEDPAGRGSEENWAVTVSSPRFDRPPRYPRRHKMQSVGKGLPLHHGCRKAGPGLG